MSAVVVVPDLRVSTLSFGRRVRNALATVWIVASVIAALVPLVAIVGYVAVRGYRIVDVTFLTSDIPIVSTIAGGGMAPAVVGTFVITGAASLMAIPLGILGAIYLNEIGRNGNLATIIRFLADVMTGVPSIVMGLFVYTIWVLRFGQSGFAGALALACLMLPVVIRSTEEILKLVPDDLRRASAAMGARQWRTVAQVVLPAALPGIVSGSMLAVARAAGETAPLLFCVGTTRMANPDLFNGPNTALTAQIFSNAASPFVPAIDRAWGAALTLIVIVVSTTILARIVSARYATRSS